VNVNRILSAAFGCACLFASSCSSTSLTDSWQAPSLHRKEMNDVLVVGVTSNMTNRILFERGFVEALTQRGIRATASYDAIGGSTPTREAVMTYLAKGGQRYVIATRPGALKVTKERVPESVRTYYTGGYYPTFSGYWDANTITMTRDSYVDTTTTLVLTTSIYEVSTQELVWAGRSKTFQVGSIAYEANELAHQIVKNIRN
jgi:hypothetical protein